MGRGEFSTIPDLILHGDQDPEQDAIVSRGLHPLTYRELRLQIVSFVRSMNATGFCRNDRIAIVSPPGPETAVAIVAVMAGFTAVPLDTQYREQEYTDIFSRTGIRGVMVLHGTPTAATGAAVSMGITILEMIPSQTAGKFSLLPALPEPHAGPVFAMPADTAYLLLTSGTTGPSKIVLRGQAEATCGKIRTYLLQKISPADRCLHIVPFHHGIGISASLLVPLAGGATVICPRDFIPSDFPGILREERPTLLTATPALCHALLRALRKTPREQLKGNPLRYIRVSSGVMPADLQRDLEEYLGVPVIDSYGMTESGLIAINFPPKRGSVGIPVSGSLAIMDETLTPLGPNRTGEIFIKDDILFRGYEGRPEENAAAFINGWFRTGDLGFLDDEGYLFLTGRRKEIINKGGEKISPEEIDGVLKSNPRVRDAMTFGIPDPVLGEDIAALVVPADPGLTEQDLRVFLLDRLVHFKVPRLIRFTGEIPRNPLGKPLRNEGIRHLF